MEYDDIDTFKNYGLDVHQEDYEEWLLSPEGQAVKEEMFNNGDDIEVEIIDVPVSDIEPYDFVGVPDFSNLEGDE